MAVMTPWDMERPPRSGDGGVDGLATCNGTEDGLTTWSTERPPRLSGGSSGAGRHCGPVDGKSGNIGPSDDLMTREDGTATGSNADDCLVDDWMA